MGDMMIKTTKDKQINLLTLLLITLLTRALTLEKGRYFFNVNLATRKGAITDFPLA